MTTTNSSGIRLRPAHDLATIVSELDLRTAPTEPPWSDYDNDMVTLGRFREALVTAHDPLRLNPSDPDDYLFGVLEVMCRTYVGRYYLVENGAELISLLRSTAALHGNMLDTHDAHTEAIVRTVWMLHSKQSQHPLRREPLRFFTPDYSGNDEVEKRLALLLCMSQLPEFSQNLLAVYFADELEGLFDWYDEWLEPMSVCHGRVRQAILAQQVKSGRHST